MPPVLVDTFLPFAVAVYLLALAPGPTAMLVVRQAMTGGRRAAVGASAGTYVALALEWTLLAASRYVVLALLAVRAGAVLGSDGFRLWTERLTGVTLVGLGAQIAASPTR